MNDSVTSILNRLLSDLGFKRKGNYWYKNQEEVIQIVGLQKSSWGKQYYLNLGVWVKKIEQRVFPKVADCHVQCRADAISDNADDIRRALDEEDSWKLDPEGRKEILKFALFNAQSIFFQNLDSLDSVRRYLKNEGNSNCAITQSLKAFVSATFGKGDA